VEVTKCCGVSLGMTTGPHNGARVTVKIFLQREQLNPQGRKL
jgi:hypothetical protein